MARHRTIVQPRAVPHLGTIATRRRDAPGPSGRGSPCTHPEAPTRSSTSPSALLTALVAALWSFPSGLEGQAAATGGPPPPTGVEAAMRAYEEADREGRPRPGGVLFAGNAIIARWESLTTDLPGVVAVNRGIAGATIMNLTAYADRVVLPYRPAEVVVYVGDDELGRGMTGEQIFGAYQSFVDRVHLDHPAARITWISVKPSPSLWARAEEMRAVNDLVRDYARRDTRLVYVDVFTPMLDASGSPRADLFLPDGLHLSPAGYALWGDVVGRFLGR